MFIPPRTKKWIETANRALPIWNNRMHGVTDNTWCPLCEHVSSLRNLDSDKNSWKRLDDGACCFCILRNCENTPYRLYRECDNTIIDLKSSDLYVRPYLRTMRKFFAGEMYKMLKAYVDNDMETFRYYLTYVEHWYKEYSTEMYSHGCVQV
jgi:hypothetical protein